MRIAVIGAGIVGMTTAYELSADGHRVTVFERRGSVAAENSFAHAGLMAPGSMSPWAAPGMPGRVLRHLLSRHAPVRFAPTLSPATFAWAWKCVRASRPRTYQANRLRLQRLAGFSQDRLHELTRTLKLDYERAEGLLLLLRTAKDQARVESGLSSMSELNVRFEALDARQCRTVEPGLNPDATLHGGIYLTGDEVGNCRQFAHLLRHEALRLGARFRFHTSVRRIVAGPGPQLVHLHLPPDASLARPDPADRAGAPTEPMPFAPVTENFDAVVVCAALGAPALLRPHGLKLPLQAVHGHSLTAPLRQLENHPELGPRSALMDERHQITLTRLGTRVRVSGGAEIGGRPEQHSEAAFKMLYAVLHDWFPGAARLSQAQRWKGARPMLPDGPPVLGASGIEGVWLNLGHGGHGWALACGSARLLADSIASRPPAVAIEGLGIERLLG